MSAWIMSFKLYDKIAFPKEFPPVTTGILLLEKGILITGHENGFVVKWKIEDSSHQILFKSDSAVTTISFSGNEKIAVGYHSGGLYVIHLEGKDDVVTLRQPRYTVSERIWRTLWPDEENLVITSTYGELTTFHLKPNGDWEENRLSLKGHSDSIFGIGSHNGRFIATGDYKGNIIVWEFNGSKYDLVQRLSVVGTIQDICWHNEQCFTAITRTGKIHLIEGEPQKDKSWQTVLEVDVADSPGTCIEITEDGNTVFAGTYGGIIQFDLDNYLSETIQIHNARRIFSSGNQIFVLIDKGLYFFEKQPIEIKEELIKYKFAKISLLGHTGTGKTAFCNRMLYNNVNNIYSTFGKRVFNWQLEKETGIEKRIVFHDHGGQETVLDTFIPFLKDSDVILIFFKQIDRATFNKSLEILEEIREKVSKDVPVYFVQTFVDHKLVDVPEEVVKNLIEKHEIVDCIRLSPKDNTGFGEFNQKIVDNINWDKTRTMIQSPFIEGISETLSQVHKKGYPVIPFDMFKQTYQDIIGKTISERHLKFLLEDFTNQGIIEFYPEVSELLILDDETFNKMRTDIPIYVDNLGGIADINDLAKRFGNEMFLEILDEMYLKSGIAIKNGNLRIFPHKLAARPPEIPQEYRDMFADAEPIEIYVSYQKVEIGRLIELLSEMHLQCAGVNRNEGLFCWEDNACVYYYVQEERRGISQRYIKFSYYVGGQKEKTKERLKGDFSILVERLYGPVVDVQKENSKKKFRDDYEFEVALSFAGEQREYVEQVANILEHKGIRVFYDRFRQSHLWGKNLVEYFQEVYYSKSKFCIMFVSRDYLQKMWPVHERRSATARDLEQFGEYILPVIFEEIDVPGLDKYKGYLDARKLQPEDIARIFLEKLEHDEKNSVA